MNETIKKEDNFDKIKIELERNGVHGECDSCDQPVYAHMKQNIEIYDVTGLCGVCATGEAATYFDEL
jgi:Zn finger protein HypA/HybF involved in hydrogenase expression